MQGGVKDRKQHLVKWSGLDDCHNSWEDDAVIERLQKRALRGIVAWDKLALALGPGKFPSLHNAPPLSRLATPFAALATPTSETSLETSLCKTTDIDRPAEALDEPSPYATIPPLILEDRHSTISVPSPNVERTPAARTRTPSPTPSLASPVSPVAPVNTITASIEAKPICLDSSSPEEVFPPFRFDIQKVPKHNGEILCVSFARHSCHRPSEGPYRCHFSHARKLTTEELTTLRDSWSSDIKPPEPREERRRETRRSRSRSPRRSHFRNSSAILKRIPHHARVGATSTERLKATNSSIVSSDRRGIMIDSRESAVAATNVPHFLSRRPSPVGISNIPPPLTSGSLATSNGDTARSAATHESVDTAKDSSSEYFKRMVAFIPSCFLCREDACRILKYMDAMKIPVGQAMSVLRDAFVLLPEKSEVGMVTEAYLFSEGNVRLRLSNDSDCGLLEIRNRQWKQDFEKTCIRILTRIIQRQENVSHVTAVHQLCQRLGGKAEQFRKLKCEIYKKSSSTAGSQTSSQARTNTSGSSGISILPLLTSTPESSMASETLVDTSRKWMRSTSDADTSESMILSKHLTEVFSSSVRTAPIGGESAIKAAPHLNGTSTPASLLPSWWQPLT